MPTTQKSRPANAKYLAKARVNANDPTLVFPMEPGTTHPFEEVELFWGSEGRLKVKIESGKPGVIRQAYLTGGAGSDLVIEVEPR
jgi:hypothetical protein